MKPLPYVTHTALLSCCVTGSMKNRVRVEQLFLSLYEEAGVRKISQSILDHFGYSITHHSLCNPWCHCLCTIMAERQQLRPGPTPEHSSVSQRRSQSLVVIMHVISSTATGLPDLCTQTMKANCSHKWRNGKLIPGWEL